MKHLGLIARALIASAVLAALSGAASAFVTAEVT